jgi:type I restriction enzyme M protein
MMSLPQLESWLYNAANIIRGPVDPSDYKAYIFPMLFFKRISDVYEEEYSQALIDSNGDIEYAEFSENHRFNIPKGCKWSDLQAKTSNIGAAIKSIFRKIEKANSKTLYGIFGDVEWTNKEKLSDERLKNLIEHFSLHNLSIANVEPDMAGRAYEFLIKKFADKTNKKAGEFYTPRSIVKLMTLILDPCEKESVYDPACGTGGMLLQALSHVRDKGQDVRTLELYGQERNLTTSAIARMNLIIHGLEDFDIERGDTLRNPIFRDRNKIATFDCVIANPPFSLKNWGEEVWEHDKWKRNEYGMPPSQYGDFAWVQHMIKSMAPTTGRLAVVVPHGVLFRKGSEQAIREKLIENDKLEAVIGLGDNLFYGTNLAACILVLRHRKPLEHKKKILFIDASKIYKQQRSQNIMEDSDVERVYGLYHDYADVTHLSRIVEVKEVKQNDLNLNISLYIEKENNQEVVSMDKAINNLKEAYEVSRAADEILKQKLVDIGVNI